MALFISTWFYIAGFTEIMNGMASGIGNTAVNRGQGLFSKNIDKRRVSIFYNIFISPANVTNGLRIVNEQLEARYKSALAAAPLYYTQIGAANVSIDCPPPCTRIRAVEEGNEVLTLQTLYEHCLSHPSELVVYIHNKGSFTETPQNEKLRRLLTQAVFSDECAAMPPDSGCDTCSARFKALPFFSMPGNMFVAECAYVVMLRPPKTFQEYKERTIHKAWNDTKWLNENNASKYPEWQFTRVSWVGLDRYAMEHWIHSHPHSQPCDVYPGPWGGNYQYPPNVPWIPERAVAPRDAENWKNAQFHPWIMLPGRLYEWKELYGEVPRNDSWVYSYFGPNYKPKKADIVDSATKQDSLTMIEQK